MLGRILVSAHHLDAIEQHEVIATMAFLFNGAVTAVVARPVLRRADADPAAIADFVFVVGDVDDVEPYVDPRSAEMMVRGEVDLRIGRQLAAIGNRAAIRQGLIGAQTGAVEHAAPDTGACKRAGLEGVGQPAGPRVGLVVIEIDVVVGDISEIACRESMGSTRSGSRSTSVVKFATWRRCKSRTIASVR